MFAKSHEQWWSGRMVFTFDCTGSGMIGMPLNMNDKKRTSRLWQSACSALLFFLLLVFFFFFCLYFSCCFLVKSLLHWKLCWCDLLYILVFCIECRLPIDSCFFHRATRQLHGRLVLQVHDGSCIDICSEGLWGFLSIGNRLWVFWLLVTVLHSCGWFQNVCLVLIYFLKKKKTNK